MPAFVPVVANVAPPFGPTRVSFALSPVKLPILLNPFAAPPLSGVAELFARLTVTAAATAETSRELAPPAPSIDPDNEPAAPTVKSSAALPPCSDAKSLKSQPSSVPVSAPSTTHVLPLFDPCSTSFALAALPASVTVPELVIPPSTASVSALLSALSTRTLTSPAPAAMVALAAIVALSSAVILTAPPFELTLAVTVISPAAVKLTLPPAVVRIPVLVIVAPAVPTVPAVIVMEPVPDVTIEFVVSSKLIVPAPSARAVEFLVSSVMSTLALTIVMSPSPPFRSRSRTIIESVACKSTFAA